MRKHLGFLQIAGVLLAAMLVLGNRGWGTAREVPEKEKAILAHDVYFQLKDNSAPAKAELVDACREYLSRHDGEVFFAVGTARRTPATPCSTRTSMWLCTCTSGTRRHRTGSAIPGSTSSSSRNAARTGKRCECSTRSCRSNSRCRLDSRVESNRDEPLPGLYVQLRGLAK